MASISGISPFIESLTVDSTNLCQEMYFYELPANTCYDDLELVQQ